MPSRFTVFFRLSLAVLLFGAFGSRAWAGSDTWTALPAYGGIVQALAIDPTNTNIIYAGTQGSGVFKSTDGGTTWTHAHTGLENGDVQTLAVDPSTTSRIYAGTSGNGIYRSTDSGASWTAINTGPSGLDINLNVYAIAIDPATTTTLYAATLGSLYTSADGGDSWTKLGTPTGSGAGQNLYDNAVYDIAIDPAAPSTLYVATHARGLFKYSAASWSTVWSDPRSNPDPLINNVRTVAIDATGNVVLAGTQGLGFYRSNAGGTDGAPATGDWPTHVTNASGLTTTVIRKLAMLPGNTNAIYAGAYNGFYYSSDGGTNWTESTTELNVLAIAIDPTDVTKVYAGTDQGVYKSTDGGATFTLRNSGLINLKIRGIAVDSADANYRYAAIFGGGVINSTDGGATWNYSNSGLASKDAIAVTVGPDGSGGRNLIVGLDTNGAYRSTNDGSSWTSVDPGLSTKHIGQLVADVSTTGHFFAGTRAGFLATQNAGTSWSPEVDGLDGDDYFEVNALTIDVTDPTILWGGVSSRGIFIGAHNPDDSITWTPKNTGFTGDFISAIAVDPTNSDIVYAGTKGRGMFKTIDRGETWTQSTEGLGEEIVTSLVIDPNNPATLFASIDDGGVYKSTNAGATWIAINDGMENLNATTLALDSSTSPPTLLAGTEGDGLIAIQSTTASPAPALIGGDTSNGGSGNEPWLVALAAAALLHRTTNRRRRNSK